MVQCAIGGLLVDSALAFPESPAVAAHVPIAELIDKRFDDATRTVGVVLFQCRGGLLYRAMRQRENPSIYLRPFGQRDILFDINLVKGGIKSKKRVGVPQRINE